MARVGELVGKTYFVRTFGCQMNLHDSERVAGLLDDCGCVAVQGPDEADIVVFMTCSVREKADTHLFGEASNLVRLPRPPSGRRVVAVGGCIAQRDGDRLREHIPNVDVVFGTSALASVPALLVEALEEGGGRVHVAAQGVERPLTRPRRAGASRPSCPAIASRTSTPGFPS